MKVLRLKRPGLLGESFPGITFKAISTLDTRPRVSDFRVVSVANEVQGRFNFAIHSTAIGQEAFKP